MAVFRKNGKWYIDYYFEGYRVRECIGKSKTRAEQALAIRKGEILQGRFNYKSAEPKVRFEELCEIYLDYVRANKKSYPSDINSLKHLRPYFRGKFLFEITALDVERYKIMRSKKVSPASVNRELACLKHMFNLAIKWGKARVNPVKEVKLFKEGPWEMRILSREEEKLLIENAALYLKPIIIMALNAGMRRGEILGLTWDKVDFVNRVITVMHTLQGTPKNSEMRKVPMNNLLTNTLLDIKIGKSSGEGKAYIFCKDDGSPFGKVSKGFYAALKRAGIRHCRFHDLRHTFATRLVMKGVDLATVKELLGHKSITMTMRYAHPTSGHKKEAVELLNLDTDGHYMDTRTKSVENVIDASSLVL